MMAHDRLLAGWLLLLVLGGISGCATLEPKASKPQAPDQQWKEKIDAARRALDQNRLAASEDLFMQAWRDAQALAPGGVFEGVSLFHLARVERLRGRYEAADGLLVRLLPPWRAVTRRRGPPWRAATGPARRARPRW